MDLLLRRVSRPQSKDNYRVVARVEGDEVEIGSIGVQYGTRASVDWFWGIDTVLPMRQHEAEGSGADRADCMKRFRAAWDRFASDPEWLAEFLAMKRKRS
jgi:hypothetical protein